MPHAYSEISKIAEAVRNGLESASLCLPLTPATSLDPTRTLTQVNKLHSPDIDVVGRKSKSTLFNRDGDLQVDYEIQVIVRQKNSPPGVPIGVPGESELADLYNPQKLIQLVEEIERYFFTHALPDDRAETLVEASKQEADDSMFEEEALHNTLMFLSVVTLTFRGFVYAE